MEFYVSMAISYDKHNISPNEFRKTRAQDYKIITKINTALNTKINQMKLNNHEQQILQMEIQKRMRGG